MTLSILLALSQAAASPAAPAPADWSALPLIHITGADDMGGYAATEEVRRLTRTRLACRASVRRMPGPEQAPNVRMQGMEVSLIVLVAPDGRFLNIVAASGPCDPIRNFARALFNRHNRGRVRPPAGTSPAWYRTTISFRWEP